jgi:hypothetical protein
MGVLKLSYSAVILLTLQLKSEVILFFFANCNLIYFVGIPGSRHVFDRLRDVISKINSGARLEIETR